MSGQQSDSWIAEFLAAGDISTRIIGVEHEFGLARDQDGNGYHGYRLWMNYALKEGLAISPCTGAMLETNDGIYSGLWTHIIIAGNRRNVALAREEVKDRIKGVAPLKEWAANRE